MIRKDYEYKKVSSIIIYVLGYSGIVCTAIKAKQFHRCLQERDPYRDGKECGNDLWSCIRSFFQGCRGIWGQVFQKEDYGGSFSEIRKQIGRKYYTVIFTYDSTSVRFAFDYAAKVRIWKDTSTPLDVIFGNGMGRNFLFQSFKKQTKRFSQKGKKRAAHLIEQVPLQTENEPENIWEIKANEAGFKM